MLFYKYLKISLYLKRDKFIHLIFDHFIWEILKYSTLFAKIYKNALYNFIPLVV